MSESSIAQLADIKDANLLAARLASAGGPLLVERLLLLAQATDDPEVVRRIAETLLKFASQFQEKKDHVVYQPAIVTFDFGSGGATVEFKPSPPPEQLPFVDVLEPEPAEPPEAEPTPPEVPEQELPIPEAMDDLELKLMQMEDD